MQVRVKAVEEKLQKEKDETELLMMQQKEESERKLKELEGKINKKYNFYFITRIFFHFIF